MNKKLLIRFFVLISLIMGQTEGDEFQIPSLFDVWKIEEQGLKVLIRDAVNYYSDSNPEDSIQQMMIYDEIIIIEHKKSKDQIYQLRYGNRGKYQILINEQVKLVLSKTLRIQIIKKKYFYILDKSYIIKTPSSFEKEYLSNRAHWTNNDLYISSGSRALVDRVILRLTELGGFELTPLYALKLETGNEILGFPNQGVIHAGLLNKFFEIGLQMPIPKLLPDEYFKSAVADIDTNRILQGGIGGYGKISFFNMQFQFSFSDLENNKIVTQYIQDSTYIDFMSYSFLGTTELFDLSLRKLGYLQCSLGLSGYEISHRSLLADGSIIERMYNRDGEMLESSTSSFFGPVIRLDYVSKINEKTLDAPFARLLFQINGYKNSASWMSGIEISIKKFGFDLIYKHSIDEVDWSPSNELYFSVNYFR